MADPGRVRLVVLFGGQSAEHEVSCISAYHVLRAVDEERYALDPVGITRDGEWVRSDGALAALHAGTGALPPATSGVEALEATGTAVEPYPTVLPSAQDDLPVVVFPLLHGPHGEDGTVQGMLELAGVPFVGSGVLASALCMDKLKAKDVLTRHGLPQVRWVEARATELDDLPARVADAGLPYPVFVKPANLGSSVGVVKVTTPEELPGAAQTAADYDEWIVVEEGVDGRELEIAVLGNADPRASVPGEVLPTGDFYDYDDKYIDGTAELRIPADLPDGVAEEMARLAVRAFEALRCDGMARVDFFFEEGGRGLLLNEVNTIPGFTPISMYPKLWEASGLPYGELVDELVRLAIERHERRARFSTKR
ncbi:MAG TPA: D-alanine--D-alanine ligase family protein [Acidimicrobiales bacterium]|nr:D-alanine--D-alanine ligase family protein [Acidimicrobiales bacterium]